MFQAAIPDIPLRVDMGSFGQPTINDVARRADVSNMTVSRVVTGNGYVSAKTRKRVEAAIEALGYQPNAAAKSMRTKSTQSIGFILPDLANTAHALVAQTAEELLARQGYRMILGSTGYSPEREAQFFSSSQQNTVDGVIAVITDETQASIHDIIQKSRVPIVILDRDLPFPVDTVYSEDRSCIRDVVHYLARLGHKRIGLMTCPLTARPGRLRHRAFHEALREMDLEPDASLIKLRHQVSSNGHQATLELLRHPHPPTALIVAADQLTFGALRAIHEMGLRIPDDISLVGADEGFLSSIVNPPLTVIWRDVQQVGIQAANMLLARLADEAQPALSATVRSEVILRQSCDRPREVAAKAGKPV
jgi:LacI family transcriptional regulator